MPKEYAARAVGRVESPLTDRGSTPRQGDEGVPDCTVAFEPVVADALEDVAPGVFSTRSADRPNPIGLHRVTVLEVDGTRLRVSGLEAIDGTPVLDLKPVLGGVDER